jgi:hypothetical protein
LAIAAQTAASPDPSPDAPPKEGTVILFLVDNSASLPPLDPAERRVDALEKMLAFVEGEPYRLILFGGHNEISVDDVQRYRNDGQWTDFYHAFESARGVMAEYPAGTSFRMVLVTDGVSDPSPRDWTSVAPGPALGVHVRSQLLAILEQTGVPLYVILVGKAPADALVNREQAPHLVLDMVRAANGAFASPRAQSLAEFFDDDGVLLKKFVYRVEPQEGLARIEPVVKRIVATSHGGVELQFLSSLVLPLALFICLLLGILVRTFPGPGDVEVVELGSAPVHVSSDKFHKLKGGGGGGWATQGLALVAQTSDAAATFTYEAPIIELSGRGLSVGEDTDSLLRRLFPLDLDELRKKLRDLSLEGTKDEKIYVLNLNYMAANLDSARAEQVLSSPVSKRHEIAPLEFLQAKAHLLVNAALKRKLTDARVRFQGYGQGAETHELQRDDTARIGRYTFRVKAIAKGGRKEVQLILSYERVPSLFGLKNILPDAFQRAFRLRRSSWRVVTS